MIQEILQKTSLRDIMKSPAITVNERDDFHVVHEKFVTHDIRHVPVVNDTGVVTGIISQRDLYKIHSPRRLEDGGWYYDQQTLDSFILKNVMNKDPFMLKADKSLKEAMDAMVRFKIGCVTIVDEYKLPLGVVTRIDIIKFFLKHA